jgi:hypothetical protein
VAFLQQFSPAGFEHFVHELSELAEYLALPPHPVPLDHALVTLTVAGYGCIITIPTPSPR